MASDTSNECSITVEPPNAPPLGMLPVARRRSRGRGSPVTRDDDEVQVQRGARRRRGRGSPVTSDDDVEEQRRESSADADQVRRKVGRLNKIVFLVALLEWAGNAVGALAFLWATVVLLGGFSTMLNRTDYWFFTAMIFMETTRVFIRNDATVNQWLFGSTRAFRFRWELSVPDNSPPGSVNGIAVLVGVGFGLITPLEFRPEIVIGILKAVTLVIVSQPSRRPDNEAIMCNAFLQLNMMLLAFGILWWITGKAEVNTKPNFLGWLILWILGGATVAVLTDGIMSSIPFMRNPVPQVWYNVIVALGLALMPCLQSRLASYYTYFSIAVAVGLLIISTSNQKKWRKTLEEAAEAAWWVDEDHEVLMKIIFKILPILFCWSLMLPFPGISLKISFYVLFSVIAGVLMIGNLQIPVVFLQVLISILRLVRLLGHHHHHDYQPLPDGASPNLVPSIVIFYMLELCQGLSYMVAAIVGLVSLPFSVSHVLGFGLNGEWGVKAVNQYYHQVYQACAEKGLFSSEKYTPSLTSFAIESLGCTSSEIQILALRILDNFLEEWDLQSKKELITEINSTSHKAAVSSLIDMLSSTVKDVRLLATRIIKELIASGSIKIFEFPDIVKRISSLLVADNKQIHEACLSILQGLACDADNCAEIAKDATIVITKIIGLIRYFTSEENGGGRQHKYKLQLSLNLLRRLSIIGGKIGTSFRQELSENPFLLNSLQYILDLEDCQKELWEPVMDIVAKLALDEAARQEIGSSQAVVGKLMRAFLRPDDDANPSENNGVPLRMAAGEALANLTIMSTDNCWAILLAEAEAEHNLVVNLIDMLDNEYYICVAANLLHNLCANSGDKLVELGKQHLESAVRKVMEMIMTREGKQLEAALCVASQIGYVIPEYCAQVLESGDTNSATALVEKLLHTVSIREPCLEYPRIRRVLVEVVISIVELCPRYINIFREKRAKDALDMVKGTPSRLEKYRVFLGGQGVVAEILPMRDLVDKAKRLIH